MVVLMPIERETLHFFLFLQISQMLNVSNFGNTADIYATVHLVPTRVSISLSIRATAAVIRLRKSGD